MFLRVPHLRILKVGPAPFALPRVPQLARPSRADASLIIPSAKAKLSSRAHPPQRNVIVAYIDARGICFLFCGCPTFVF